MSRLFFSNVCRTDLFGLLLINLFLREIYFRDIREINEFAKIKCRENVHIDTFNLTLFLNSLVLRSGKINRRENANEDQNRKK